MEIPYPSLLGLLGIVRPEHFSLASCKALKGDNTLLSLI